MAASNTVEATLRSKYQDGISRGLQQTQAVLQGAMNSMRGAMSSAVGVMSAAWTGLTSALEGYRERIRQAGQDSDSQFKRMSAAAAAFAIGAGLGILKLIQMFSTYAMELVTETSAVTELKLAYEALSQARGIDGLKLLDDLKLGTERLVGTAALLRNANRILQSNVEIAPALYARLSANVHSLAKSVGVDAVEAQKALTDSVIKGNTRQLASIGIHLNVRDAVSEVAAAMGVSATAIAGHAKLQAFYNELLRQTDASAARLPQQFVSLQDAVDRTNKSFRDYLVTIGEGVNRSGVFQELLKKFVANLDTLTLRKESVTQLAISVNNFLLGALRWGASVIDMLALLSLAWDTMVGVVHGAANLTLLAIYAVVGSMAAAIERLAILAAKIPGPMRAAYQEIAKTAAYVKDFSTEGARQHWDGLLSSFDGFGEKRVKLDGFALTTRNLASELQALSATVVTGSAALAQQGDSAEVSAEQIKKLTDQLQKYDELTRSLRSKNATPEGKALMDLGAQTAKADELTMIGEERRNRIKLLAYKNYLAELERLDKERADKAGQAQQEIERLNASITAESSKAAGEQFSAWLRVQIESDAQYAERVWQEISDKIEREAAAQRNRAVSDAIAAANAIAKASDASQRSRLGREVGAQARAQAPAVRADLQRQLNELRRQPVVTNEQIDQILQLESALEKLNRIDMTPFQQLLGNLRESVNNMAAATTEAFANFWADMVSGQENAGKKFIAALLDMVANELLVRAMRMTALAIEHAAMLDFAGAARYAAAAAGISALAGILKGFAANLANAKQEQDAQPQQMTSTRSSQTSVIQVGAPRGAQNVQSAATQPVQGEIRIKVEPPTGWVTKQVEKDIRRNGRLRVVLANA